MGSRFREGVMAPFSRLYRAVVLKMNKHEDEATTSGVTDGAGSELPNRVIFINRPQPQKFLGNRISTAKYSIPSFIPLFLFEQFRRYSNCFFLLIALLQQIPDVSPTGRWTTLTPLILILSVSAIKEIVEDFKRHRADDETNRRRVDVLRNGAWQTVSWEQLQVGDICKVLNDQFFPADLIMLSSSEPQGISFIETSNLDGETNLKIRQAHMDTARLDNTAALAGFRATIQCEPPNRHLYEFNGQLKETNAKTIPLGLDQMMLRGSMLRNTAFIYGAIIYTGHETKLMKNSTKAPLKRSSIDKQTNTQILMLFSILLVLSLLSATFNELWQSKHLKLDWYIGLTNAQNSNFGFNFLTFLILYNNLIPISLQVTAEIVRFFQAKFISMDSEMYHAATDTPAQARTSNLNEELGMVKYIFSDKTGTLTCNMMEFHKCSIAEKIYSKPAPGERIEDCLLHRNLSRGHPTAPVILEFLTMLAVCHTVIPEQKDGEMKYHAASPDERALVLGAAEFGYVFEQRTPAAVTIRPFGKEPETYEVLNVIDFTSARKRMSVIVRTPSGQIKLYCKGADNVIYPRLTGGPDAARYADGTLEHLEAFATEGLRTLVFADADISEEAYQEWANTYHKACVAIHDREKKIEEAAMLIENNLKLLGATAIEDKLQDGVPETIASLLKANINVWVLTGDKQETAINIAHSARLVSPSMPIIIFNEDSLDATRECLSRHVAEFGENLRKQNEVALIIDGTTLKYAMGCDLKKDFLDLCISCKAVVCCRVSPIQKAEVVEMVSVATGAVTLAIGDGANDVAMIQRASVGVGISGVEGLQAVCASDYSIAQFRFLLRLLLVHGAWNYSRISTLILYSFYKNICLYVIELWFAIYSAWSGQILFERWTIGFYNVMFTALPPFAIGLFDKICSGTIMLRHPILYLPSQQGLLFNVRVFWVWVINSLLHSVLLFWLPMLMCSHDILWPHGKDGGYLVMGNVVYTYVVLTVCLKAGLATHSWTWVTHVAIWASIGMWMIFVIIYSNLYPLVNLGAVFLGMDRMVFSSLAFWLGLLLVPATTLIPDFVFTVMGRTYGTRTAPKLGAMVGALELPTPSTADFMQTPAMSMYKLRERSVFKLPKAPEPAREITLPSVSTQSQRRRASSAQGMRRSLSNLIVNRVLSLNARRYRVRNSMFKTMTEAVRESEIKQRDPAALLAQPRHSLTETARLLQNVRSVFSRRSTRAHTEFELSHGFAFSQEEGGSVSQADVIRAYDTRQPRPARS